MSETNSVQVTDPAEIAAVKTGDIVGDAYDDGEVWAVAQSLQAWRERQPKP